MGVLGKDIVIDSDTLMAMTNEEAYQRFPVGSYYIEKVADVFAVNLSISEEEYKENLKKKYPDRVPAYRFDNNGFCASTLIFSIDIQHAKSLIELFTQEGNKRGYLHFAHLKGEREKDKIAYLTTEQYEDCKAKNMIIEEE